MLSTEKQVGLMRIEMVETGLNLLFKNGKEGKKRERGGSIFRRM